MSKKDYIKLAGIIASSESLRELVNNLSDWLEADNPRFKPEVFKTACMGIDRAADRA